MEEHSIAVYNEESISLKGSCFLACIKGELSRKTLQAPFADDRAHTVPPAVDMHKSYVIVSLPPLRCHGEST